MILFPSFNSNAVVSLFVFEEDGLLRDVGALEDFDDLPSDSDAVKEATDLEKILNRPALFYE